MNADKRRWFFATLVGGFVMLGTLEVQAEDVVFKLGNRPDIKLPDEIVEVSEPILHWAFPTSAKFVGKIGSEKQEVIFGGFTR